MKIGMISCWYPYIGVSDYTSELINSLRSLFKEELDIFSGPCYCQLRVGSLPRGRCQWYSPILNRFSKIFGRFRYTINGVLWSLWMYFKTRKLDIIHYQLCSGYFGLQTLLFFLFLPKRVKIVVTFHEFKFKHIKSKLQLRILSKIDKVIVHSQFSKEYLVNSFPFLRDKTKIIHHGVRIPRLGGYKREEITFFGAPTRIRGGLYLLEALKILKKRNKPILLNIYGFGTKEEKEEFQKCLINNSLEENIEIGGILNNRLFYQKLQESKFVILPRLEGHASGILLKSMASGTPIVATNVGGIPEYLGNAGLIVPLKEPEILASAIQELDENESLRQKRGKTGRERALKLFSWKNIATETSEVYMSLIKDDLSSSTKRMKIVFFSNMYPPDYLGGGEIYCSYVTESLIRRGNIVKVLARKSSFNSPEYVKRLLHFKFRDSSRKTALDHLSELYLNFFNLKVAFRYLKYERPDLVAMWYPHGITISPLLAAEILKIPYVIHAGSLWPWDGILKHKLLLRNLKRLFVVNKNIKEQLIEIGIDQEKIKVVMGGVDTNIFKNLPIEREDSLILFVGQLLWSKGVHILIYAFLELLTTIKNAKLIIIGSGSANYEKYLKKIAKRNEKIIFLGKIPHDELVTCYNKARVLVCPSVTQEGIPLVALEAMICGLPVITSDTTGISDIVRNGDTGLIFPSGNIKALYERLHILLKDKTLWNRFSKNSENISKANYDWNSIVKTIENEYWEIIGN